MSIYVEAGHATEDHRFADTVDNFGEFMERSHRRCKQSKNAYIGWTWFSKTFLTSPKSFISLHYKQQYSFLKADHTGVSGLGLPTLRCSSGYPAWGFAQELDKNRTGGLPFLRSSCLNSWKISPPVKKSTFDTKAFNLPALCLLQLR